MDRIGFWICKKHGTRMRDRAGPGFWRTELCMGCVLESVATKKEVAPALRLVESDYQNERSQEETE